MQTMKGNTNNQTIYKRPTPPRLNKALSSMETKDTGREGKIVEEGHLEWGWRRRGRRWVRLREMPIPPSVKTRTKVLKVLILRNNHPSELIVPLLDKLPKSGMLRSTT